jgi:N6-adenosine-specific RNA methylase IME4
MEGAGFDALVEDIKCNGLREPVVLHDGAILDGRNRHRACLEAGVPIRTEQFEGDDPLKYVISLNLHRRHLDESQRDMVAARLATAPEGRRKKTAQNYAVSQDEAAVLLNVSRRGVQQAKAVLDKGISELAARVDQGEVAVSIAAQIAQMPEAKQRKLVSETAAVLRGAAKKEKRATREREFAEITKQVMANFGTKLYGLIYADPPWRFEPYSRDTGMDRAADNHYETMRLDDIKAMAVPAATDCVLFLWATAPMLPEALSVMEAWGFTYKSHCIWVKDRVGTGYWFRNKHELLLVGTRGKVPAPAPGEQFASVIEAALAEHSRKPQAFADAIEEMFPNVPGIELFARGERLGWDAWGAEAAT